MAPTRATATPSKTTEATGSRNTSIASSVERSAVRSSQGTPKDSPTADTTDANSAAFMLTSTIHRGLDSRLTNTSPMATDTYDASHHPGEVRTLGGLADRTGPALAGTTSSAPMAT